MSSLRNKVNLIGHLAAKPELYTLNGGKIVARFRLATSELFKDKEGEWKQNTQWHNAVMWGKAAERFTKSTEKGSEVAIEGRLVNKQYEKNGEKRYSTEVEAREFLVLTSKAAQ